MFLSACFLSIFLIVWLALSVNPLAVGLYPCKSFAADSFFKIINDFVDKFLFFVRKDTFGWSEDEFPIPK